jgi:O-antigen/teichoic acid export membrane protein
MFGRAGLQFAQLAIFARMLSIDELGLYAIVAGLASLFQIFAEVGISANLIHRKEVDPATFSAARMVSLAAGCAVAVVQAALARVLAQWYGNLGLWLPITIVALSPLAVAIGQPFRALGEREFRFRAIALIELSSAVVGLVVALWLILERNGVVGAAAGFLATSATQGSLCYLIFRRSDLPLHAFSRARLKSIASFGGLALVNNLCSTLIQQADIFIGGKLMPPSQLGLFSAPRDLCLRIGMVVNPIVSRVGLPIMARYQEDRRSLGNVYLTGLNAATSLGSAFYLFIACHPSDVAGLLLGPKWVDQAPLISVLALWGLLRSSVNPAGALLFATGDVKRAAVWNALLLLVVIPLLLVAAPGGPLLLASTLLGCAGLINIACWFLLIRPTCDVTALEYASAMLRPMLCSAISAGLSTVAAVPFARPWERLLVGVLVLIFAHVLTTLAINRSLWNVLFPARQPAT